MRKKVFVLALLCLVVVGIMWVSYGYRSRHRPNILLITLDTTRRDHLSCYGHSGEITPAIDELADDGVRYESAISPSPWTVPAHASLFTGVLPTRHGARFVVDPEQFIKSETTLYRIGAMNPDLPTMAGQLKEAGYRTVGITSGRILWSQYGFARGFDRYDENMRPEQIERGAGEVSFLATQWLEDYRAEPEQRPFFLFLQYYDPHSPYRAPGEWYNPDVSIDLCDIQSERYLEVFRGTRDLTEEEHSVLLSQYANEIRFLDTEIGRLFDEMRRLGLYDNCLIVLTAEFVGFNYLSQTLSLVFGALVGGALIDSFGKWKRRFKSAAVVRAV